MWEGENVARRPRVLHVSRAREKSTGVARARNQRVLRAREINACCARKKSMCRTCAKFVLYIVLENCTTHPHDNYFVRVYN